MVPDEYAKRILWHFIAGTRGGINRARILKILKDTPKNTNQLAEELHLDYKTVQHHIDVLTQNRLIEPSKQDAYGALYFLSPMMQQNYQAFEEIWVRIGSRQIK
jgi:predicted transcriptional regulator